MLLRMIDFEADFKIYILFPNRGNVSAFITLPQDNFYSNEYEFGNKFLDDKNTFLEIDVFLHLKYFNILLT